MPLLGIVYAPCILTPHSCLRNVVALFHVLEKEIAWRKENGKPEGFEALKTYKPIVAVGAEHPLEDDELAADYFRKTRPRNLKYTRARTHTPSNLLQTDLMAYMASTSSTLT